MKYHVGQRLVLVDDYLFLNLSRGVEEVQTIPAGSIATLNEQANICDEPAWLTTIKAQDGRTFNFQFTDKDLDYRFREVYPQ